MIARSPAMRHAVKMALACAPSKISVLLLGETGTGKDVLARFIHAASTVSGAFVPAHLGAIPDGLVESELFGHARGSFTGAEKRREGLLVAARGGTLFLDEIGDIPLAAQAKLLRTLSGGRVRAVGSDAEVVVDFRIISATNRDLAGEVKAGRFRADLYHRINGFQIAVPSLRQRVVDVIALYRAAERRHGLRLPLRIRRDLRHHAWPGNVRELESVVERAAMLEAAGLLAATAAADLLDVLIQRDPEDVHAVVMAHAEKMVARYGSKFAACRAMKIDPSTLYRWTHDFGLRIQAGRRRKAKPPQ
jgi:anaerobic nitric oxide reductase transcription regulator